MALSRWANSNTSFPQSSRVMTKKIRLVADIEFEDWSEEQIPKSQKEWEDFFAEFFLPERGVIGEQDGAMVCIKSVSFSFPKGTEEQGTKPDFSGKLYNPQALDSNNYPPGYIHE
jgi:hypothetical protein